MPLDTVRTIYLEHRNLFPSAQPREEYFKSLAQLTARVEQTLRQYLSVSCALVFGQYQNQRMDHYPEEIRKYITSSMSPISVTREAVSEFENLNRGQYRLLFTQAGKTSPFARLIIKPITQKWDSADLTAFFNIFGEANIISGHLKMSRVEEIKKDVPTYFRLACRLLADISTRIVQLVTRDNTILRDNDRTFVVFGYQHKKQGSGERVVEQEAVTGLAAPPCQHEITGALNREEIERIMAVSDNVFGTRELNLLDIEGAQIKLGAAYCESMALLANAIAKNEVQIIPSYGADVHLVRKV